MITIKQLFIQFLKQNNIYEQYIGNIYKNSFNNLYVFSKDILNEPMLFIRSNINLWASENLKWRHYDNKWTTLCHKQYVNMFLHFLEQHNIQDKYKKELKKISKKPIKEFLNTCEEPSSFISNAFIWNHTSQGVYFWAEYHNKWIEIYHDTI